MHAFTNVCVDAVDQSIGSGQREWDIHDFIDHATKGSGETVSHAPAESASSMSGLLRGTILMDLECVAAPELNSSTGETQQADFGASLQVARVQKMLGDEFGTASNIKNRVNRQSVLGAITSAQQRLKLYNKVGVASNGT